MMTIETIKAIGKTVLVGGLVALITSPACAQTGMSNARSVAMGGAYTALARGIEAPSWNPANLGLSSRRMFRLNFVSLGVGIHNNSFNKKDYDLYNGKSLTAQDKSDILAAIPAYGLQGDIDTEVQAMGINIGRFALTSSGMAASRFIVPKDLVELALYGNELDRTYDIDATDGEGWAVSSFAVSTAFRLSVPMFREFSVGVSAKYIKGLAYGKLVEGRSTALTDINGFHTSGSVVIDRALGGNGYAFDFGAAGAINDNWSVSLGFANVLSSVGWSDRTKRYTYTFNADSLTVELLDGADFDSLFVDSEETVDIDPFSTRLPAQLRFGVARTSRRLTLAFDYLQGLSTTPGVSTKPKLAFGTEYRLIHFLPLRTGFSVGGRNGFSSSVGFAFDFSAFSWDFALASRGGMFNGRGLSFAFDWMFRL